MDLNLQEIRIIAHAMDMSIDQLVEMKCPEEIGIVNGLDETDGCMGRYSDACDMCWKKAQGFMTRDSFSSDEEYEEYLRLSKESEVKKKMAKNKEKEQVNHPEHYSQPNRRECIEEMRIVFGDEAVRQWCVMTAYKYRYRTGNKEGNSADQDNKKAEWYLDYAEEMM